MQGALRREKPPKGSAARARPWRPGTTSSTCPTSPRASSHGSLSITHERDYAAAFVVILRVPHPAERRGMA